MSAMRSVGFAECEKEFKDKVDNLHHSFTCFRGNYGGTCSGDGGGPLVCPIDVNDEDGRYMQVSNDLKLKHFSYQSLEHENAY